MHCIAATNQADTKASFSTHGKHVALSAPGVDIYSTVPGGYGKASGTSMATPITSSAVALLLAHGANDPIKLLQDTADPMPNDSSYTSGQMGA